MFNFLCVLKVLVGAPNVGKSSIVRVVSSGTPEVTQFVYFIAPYVRPFWPHFLPPGVYLIISHRIWLFSINRIISLSH